MTDATGHMNRPGAGLSSSMMSLEGKLLNCYLNHNPQNGRVEIVKPMASGQPDKLIKDFADESSAWDWARSEFAAGRLPL